MMLIVHQASNTPVEDWHALCLEQKRRPKKANVLCTTQGVIVGMHVHCGYVCVIVHVHV